MFLFNKMFSFINIVCFYKYYHKDLKRKKYFLHKCPFISSINAESHISTTMNHNRRVSYIDAIYRKWNHGVTRLHRLKTRCNRRSSVQRPETNGSSHALATLPSCVSQYESLYTYYFS